MTNIKQKIVFAFSECEWWMEPNAKINVAKY